MAKINSPLGSKSFQGGMREFVVPDADEEQEVMQSYQENQGSFYQPQNQQQNINYRQAFQQRANASANQDSRISEGARKRIEVLCGMTTLTKNVQVGDATFTLSSLKTKDNRNALLSSVKYDGTVEFSFELRKQILARSIVAISDVEISMFLGTNDFEAKLDFIDELDDVVSNKLYNEYLALDKEVKEKFFPKTEKEAKELAEEVKK